MGTLYEDLDLEAEIQDCKAEVGPELSNPSQVSHSNIHDTPAPLQVQHKMYILC
jgi:hypothetical protein